MSGQLDHFDFDPVMWPHTHLNYNEERSQDGKEHVEPEKDQESQHYLTIGKSQVVRCRQDKDIYNGDSFLIGTVAGHAWFQHTNGGSGSYDAIVKMAKKLYDIPPRTSF